MDFSVPLVNTSLHLVEADPFVMYHRKNNQTCSITYSGPRNAIVSEDCVYSVNVHHTDLVMSPARDCQAPHNLPDTSKYFNLDKCVPRQATEAWDFIQIKPLSGHYHIYCYGNNFSVGGRTDDCPKETFVIPMSTNFQINNHMFNSLEYQLNHQERLDPVLSMKTNWHLNPNIDLEDLVKKIENQPDLVLESDIHPLLRNHGPTINIITMSALVVLTLVILVLVFYIRKTRKINVQVSRDPTPEEIPLNDRDQERVL